MSEGRLTPEGRLTAEAIAALEARFANFPKYATLLMPLMEPAPPKRVKKVPKIISTLIRSRQTPKIRLRDVRRVIRGRSKTVTRIFYH